MINQSQKVLVTHKLQFSTEQEKTLLLILFTERTTLDKSWIKKSFTQVAACSNVKYKLCNHGVH